MTTSLFAVQEAVYAQLSADVNLQALVGSPARLYDMVPPAAIYPYVSFGDVNVRDYGTKDRTGFEQTLTFHAYSRARGRKEVKQIMQALYDSLHQSPLSVVGADRVDCQFQSASTQLENDSLTLHGIIRFRIVVQH